MAEPGFAFSDGAAYERQMGRWSRSVGEVFLDWLGLAPGLRILDAGCGTGVFTALLAERCAPKELVAVDPSKEQVDHARGQPVGKRADFRVADAQALPFPDRGFDAVLSALVINFIPDRPRALAEMRRVTKPGGTVAGYVWDFAGGRAPPWPLRRGLLQIGASPPPVPGVTDSAIPALTALFEQAGFVDIAVRPIEVTVSYPDFDDLWTALTPAFNPLSKLIASLPAADRTRLIETVRASLPAGPDGTIAYASCAHAIKARVPA